MDIRYDLQQQVETELKQKTIDIVTSIFADSNYHNHDNVYHDLLGSGYLDITAPKESTTQMSFLTFDSLRNYKSGSSIKPGNILLNMRKLMDSIPGIIEMGCGIVFDIPILKVCAALNLWGTLRGVFTVEISKEQAFTMIALWNNCDYNHKISLEEGLLATNELRNRCNEPELSSLAYSRVIDDLIALQCIEVTEGIIWLRERVSKKYTFSI